jgi:hypothetical protein
LELCQWRPQQSNRAPSVPLNVPRSLPCHCAHREADVRGVRHQVAALDLHLLSFLHVVAFMFAITMPVFCTARHILQTSPHQYVTDRVILQIL